MKAFIKIHDDIIETQHTNNPLLDSDYMKVDLSSYVIKKQIDMIEHLSNNKIMLFSDKHDLNTVNKIYEFEFITFRENILTMKVIK